MHLFPRRSPQRGLAPGTLVLSDTTAPAPRLTLITYNDQHFTEQRTEPADITRHKESGSVSWLNIDGLGDLAVLRSVGAACDVHDLVLEDILNLDQRPKADDHGSYQFIVVRMIDWKKGAEDIDIEQVSLILKENSVISIQQREGDVFDPVRERIRKNRGRIRRMGADYLLHALLDAIIDNYFPVMERLGEEIEALETEILEKPESSTVARIHALRRRVILLRRSVWPLREVVNTLVRTDSKLIGRRTLPFFRDLYDHTIQVIETLETFRDVLGGMLDVYLSTVSNRMNEVMKVLTIISTLFIPLGFVAGLYGMNFQHMPELQWRWGYPTVLAVMAALTAGFLAYFRHRRWI